MAIFRKAVVTLFAVFGAVARGEVHHLGDANFDDFVDNLPQDALLLVDFYKVGLVAMVHDVTMWPSALLFHFHVPYFSHQHCVFLPSREVRNEYSTFHIS